MKEIKIKIQHSKLIEELSKYCYTVGEQIGDDAAKQRHFIQGGTDDGHVDLLMSSLDEAWTDVLHTVSAYTLDDLCPCRQECEAADAMSKDIAEDLVVGTNINRCEDYTVTLHFPGNTFAGIGVETMTAIKRYMLARGKEEWDLLCGRDPRASEMAKERALSRLRVVISTRTSARQVGSGWEDLLY